MCEPLLLGGALLSRQQSPLRNGPLPFCADLPLEFFSCDCTELVCSPLRGVTCVDSAYLPTPFYCDYKSAYHFASAIFFSVFLGFCGVDRFYLG